VRKAAGGEIKLPSPEPRAGKAGKSGNKQPLKEELATLMGGIGD